MNLIKDPDLKQWLVDLKARIRQSQIKAMVKVNSEMLRLYWDLGRDIVVRQMESVFGNNFFEQLSKNLRQEFPDMKGFSKSNLYNMKQFYLFYSQGDKLFQQVVGKLENENLHQLGAELQTVDNKENIISQQVVGEFDNHPIFQIPWGHHIQMFTKCKSVHEALFYVQKTIDNSWSRSVLMNFLEADLYSAQGKALNNFSRLLPEAQSDLANEIIKDPYNFDFISLTGKYKEKELENALIDNITKFLLELGHGFAYVGKQITVKTGKKERFIDLLFYHTELHCYVVIELKTGEFEAEYTGKLGLYISAINHQRKKENDNPTIGLLICKTKDNVEVQYSLESSNQPIGVSEYELSKLLPENYKSALPSIEDIEKGLRNSG
jgi:predicted nuclease of restriction endonuclease-like (RecB) superfamily